MCVARHGRRVQFGVGDVGAEPGDLPPPVRGRVPEAVDGLDLGADDREDLLGALVGEVGFLGDEDSLFVSPFRFPFRPRRLEPR